MRQLKRPKNLLSSLILFIALPLSLTAAPAVIAQSFGLIWNRTGSLPVGVWRRVGPFRLGASTKGRYVLFCPPSTEAFRVAREHGMVAEGRCAGGYVPLIKEVVAIPGDLVEVGDGVAVNGTQIVNSTVDQNVAAMCGLKLPTRIGLEAGSVWLMSPYTARSFDSRYFGAIRAGSVEAFVEPIFTF